MNIVVDAMGGDKAPFEIVKGAVLATQKQDVSVTLVGNETRINEILKELEYNSPKISIVHASEVIVMEDTPTEAIKNKTDSSMVVGLKLVAEGKGDAFISAGNTGALLAGAVRFLKRIKGVNRPALAAIMPAENGPFVLMDAGANTNCKPINLVQFAIMGEIYSKNMFSLKSPRVAILSNGSEENKGTELTKEASEKLRTLPINFTGNIEAREIPTNGADVVVTDGFTGNVVLKMAEGMGAFFTNKLKKAFFKNALTKLSALFMKSSLKEFKASLDYTEYGGAPFLGVTKPIIKTHGSANAHAVMNTIFQANKLCETDIINEITQKIIDDDLEETK